MRFIAFITLFWLSLSSIASDHVDGELSIKNPVADISDVFTFVSPTNPDNLVLVLNSYPFVSSKGHFSNRLVYSFLLREAEITGKANHPSLKYLSPTKTINCTFKTPHDGTAHTMTCKLDEEVSFTSTVNEVNEHQALGIRAFAGFRADPFLFSSSWFSTLVFDYDIPKANASNDLTRLNVLSIILELPVKSAFNFSHQPILAVAGQIAKLASDGSIGEIIDRAARPEISNAHLVTTVGQEDLRASYNRQATFALADEDRKAFQARIAQNIQYYDALDGVTDWPADSRVHISEFLTDDVLLIDTSLLFNGQSYLSLEAAYLRQQLPLRPGGRAPGENSINKLMTFLINGGRGIAITSGIEQEGLPQKSFPYLAEPHSGLMNKLFSYFAPKMTAKMALTERQPQPNIK